MWIELHQAIFTHRKTIEAADILEIPEVYVVGHLAAIWTWALDNAPEGVIKARPRLIERIAQWPGEPGKLLEALLEVGFLEMVGDAYEIHDWWDYAGRLIERRKANAARAKRSYEQSTRSLRADTPQTAGLPYHTKPTIPDQTDRPARVHEEPPSQPELALPEAPSAPSDTAGGKSAPSGVGSASSRPPSVVVAEILSESDSDPARSHWRASLEALASRERPQKVWVWKAKVLGNWLAGDGAPPPPPPPSAPLSPEARASMRKAFQGGIAP